MKKILICISISLCLSPVFAQVKKATALEAVTKATCGCLQKQKAGIKSETDAQRVLSLCMMQEAGNRLPELQKELGIKTMDQQGMVKLGQAVSMKLTAECPALMDIMVSAQGKMPEMAVAAEESYEGEILKVETEGYITVQIKNPEGKITKFIWFEYFKGSDIFKDNPQLLTGKKVKIQWKPVEVYMAAQKDYTSAKELTSLVVLN